VSVISDNVNATCYFVISYPMINEEKVVVIIINVNELPSQKSETPEAFWQLCQSLLDLCLINFDKDLLYR
jgi:hypothetical protein